MMMEMVIDIIMVMIIVQCWSWSWCNNTCQWAATSLGRANAIFLMIMQRHKAMMITVIMMIMQRQEVMEERQRERPAKEKILKKINKVRNHEKFHHRCYNHHHHHIVLNCPSYQYHLQSTSVSREWKGGGWLVQKRIHKEVIDRNSNFCENF